MKCESLKFNLPLFSDDELTLEERSELDIHLAKCPVCRHKHAEFLSLKNDLRVLSRPEVPVNLIKSVKSAVKVESKYPTPSSASIFSESFREWLQLRLMPYSVGTAFSLILTISLLYTLNSMRETSQKINNGVAANTQSSAIILASNKNPVTDEQIVLTKESYAALRVPVSMESPSLNPQGAFIAITRSLARGNMKDDEVTVVADVLSNGLAQITQVIEPSRNRQSMNEFTDAFENNKNDAPFVPANLDNRSNDMRVIFKVIWVDVDDKGLAGKKTSKK